MNKRCKLDDINDNLEDIYDIFICSASFENRCLSIPEKIKKIEFRKVLIIQNNKGSIKTLENGAELKRLYPDAQVIDVEFGNGIAYVDQLISEIRKIKGKCMSVLIDMTTFTHELLMITLKYLYVSARKVQHITCIYINAKEYCPGVPVKEKWLTVGSERVTPILGYPGMFLPSNKTQLVIIVGYEYGRALDVIEKTEPNSITLIYGKTNNSITEKDKEANEFYTKLTEDMLFGYSNIEKIEASCDDPEDVARILEELYDRYDDKNIIVVPMNNKITTLGLFISLIHNEDVQVSYAPAIVYNEQNYSIPGTDCFICELK